MADDLTLAAVALSVITLASVIYLVVTIRRKPAANGMDTNNLVSTMNEVKGSVSGLQSALTQLLPTVGEIKQATDQTSSGMVEMRKFAELLSGSSQKRGRAGEIVIRHYLERLPREMWEEQFTIPGSEGRVDYVLRIYNSGAQLFLPIDAKFSLPDGTENFDEESNGLAKERAVELVKYIVPGVTTDFAVMVLPTSVFYSLTSETHGMLQEVKVVPCPSEGVLILCNLAMRAHQAVVLARSAERLRTYVIEIDGKLERMRNDIDKWSKHLKGASKYAKQTLEDIDDTRSAIGDITTRLGETQGANTATPQLDVSPPVLAEKTVEEDPSEG